MRAVLLSLFPALAAAHFRVLYPPARGFDPDKLVNYPCKQTLPLDASFSRRHARKSFTNDAIPLLGGGFDTPSSNRTSFPLSGGPIQLDFEHTQQNVQVVFALGNNPTGNDYTYTLVPTFYEQGPRSFCISNTAFPPNLNISAGTNGTILVITNGDPDGGLYNVRFAPVEECPRKSRSKTYQFLVR